ncbi:MAG TPA: phage/plasmid primase, P4 family [Gemmataceae bacterium]|nr:phage/plasmid primase, P4 family [Gemmataceae bacterium]
MVAAFVPTEQKPEPPKAFPVTRECVGNTLGALAGMAVLPGHLDRPTWLADDGEAASPLLMSFTNGLLDVDAMLQGKRDVLNEHSARWFTETAYPYAFDPKADCPKWKSAIGRILEDDADRIALVRQWFGYCLLPDTSQQRFLMLVGEGSNGKSVVCAAQAAVLGPANVSAVPLEAFAQRFALTTTLGRLANIAAEVGELDKAAEGVLKSFTSGDRMLFDRKNLQPVEAMPTARLILATNNPPRFADRSSGIWRRMLLVPFRVIIPESERVYGMDKPAWWEASGELPGILNWSLAGLHDLQQRGRFTEPSLCVEELQQYREESNPARMFLIDHYKAAEEGLVKTADVYEGYRKWCEQNGYRPLGDRSFGKEVHRAFPSTRRQRLGGRLERHWFYVGLDLGENNTSTL